MEPARGADQSKHSHQYRCESQQCGYRSFESDAAADAATTSITTITTTTTTTTLVVRGAPPPLCDLVLVSEASQYVVDVVANVEQTFTSL